MDRGPIYLDWNETLTGASDFWADERGEHVTVEEVDARGAAAIGFLYQRFSDRFTGAVIYDPEVPDTINLATMIAGAENRIMLAPQQEGSGIPELTDVVDLTVISAQQGWNATDRPHFIETTAGAPLARLSRAGAFSRPSWSERP